MKNLRRMCSLNGSRGPRTPGLESKVQGASSMRSVQIFRAALFLPLILGSLATDPANADGNLNKVKHVVVLMQGNHSFGNCFVVLAYAPAGPHHIHLFNPRIHAHPCPAQLPSMPETPHVLRSH